MTAGRQCAHERSFIGDSAFHGGSYATERSRSIFCDVCRLQRWLDVEVALAASQAELGMIPSYAAQRIAASARIEHLDGQQIRDGIRNLGHSLVPLLRALEPRIGSYSSQYLHFGATTQDIQDTAQALEMREVLDLVASHTSALMDVLEPIASHHKAQLTVGRTHAQPALPITFGLKVAGWIDELLRHVERIRQARPRVLVAQLFGGVGTMAAFRGQGPALLERFAARLGLGVPLMGWHVSRDRVSEFVFLLASTAQTLARIADEVRTLSRPPFAELEQGWGSEHLGSSTMPHKRNPESCEQVVVLARLARAQVGLSLEAMVLEHERDYRGTRLEWPALSMASHSTLAALELTTNIVGNLRVRGETMSATAGAKADAECTEALTFALGMRIGKARAFELIHKLSHAAIDAGESLLDVTLASPEVNAVMGKSRIEQIFNPSSYLGSSVELVDRVLAARRRDRLGGPAGD